MKIRIIQFLLPLFLIGCASVQTLPDRYLSYKDDEGNVVYLFEAKCSSKLVLDQVPDMYKDYMADGKSIVGGKEFKMCWLVAGNNVVFLYEDGDYGRWPVSYFVPNGAVQAPQVPQKPSGLSV